MRVHRDKTLANFFIMTKVHSLIKSYWQIHDKIIVNHITIILYSYPTPCRILSLSYRAH